MSFFNEVSTFFRNPYVTVTHYIHPIESYIKRDCKWKRLANFGLVPISLFATAIDTIVGFTASIANAATGGTRDRLHFFSLNHLSSSKKLLALPFIFFLQTINPKARLWLDYYDPETVIGAYGDGLITHSVIRKIKNSLTDNQITSNLVLRISYVGLGISCIVTRSLDGVIALGAVPASLISGGTCETANNVAYRAIQAPGLIYDLNYCAIKIIDPWTGTVARSIGLA